MNKSVEVIKGEILGYKRDLKPLTLGKSLDQVEKTLKNLPGNDNVNLPVITLKELKREAKKFYNQFFTVHEISTITEQEIYKNQVFLMNSQTGAEVARKFNSLCTIKNPFDLPIELVSGHSMVGEVKKPLIIVPTKDFRENVKIPFSHITLGNNLTKLSIATYIHEISHTQTESNIGYAESFYNKEVISIFIEKLAALELDSTGELLRISERMRYRDLYDRIQFHRTSLLAISQRLVTIDEVIKATPYVYSTLLATKLFDKYQTGKESEKNQIIYNIQQVFDGKMTIEQLLESENISLAKSKDINLIKRHI